MGFGNFKLSDYFSSPLGLTAWGVLAGVPVGIIALYFLKLRRKPVQVPSTLLWRRSLEDLHVNSLFQRLRRNLLLFLQLLAVLLAMLALTGPRLKGSSGPGQRYVLAIDNSASMAATDTAPSRLEKAKAEARKIVEGMRADDLAMVITFSDRAAVVASYTGNRGQLLRKIDAIAPTDAPTSLRDALQVAAGLANTSKTMFADDYLKGSSATEIITPKLKIFTDGGFADVEGFSLGNIEAETVVIGPPPPPVTEVIDPTRTEARPRPPSDNVAILALGTRRKDEKEGEYQVFGRVHNYRAEPVTTEARLLRHDPAKPGAEGALLDAIALTIPPRSDKSFEFDMAEVGASDLEVRIDVVDALPIDNRAFTVIGSPRKAQVLLVTPGNKYLVDTLQTPSAAQMADVTVVGPDGAKADPVARDVKAGRYDLVIYDRARPEEPPEANALYFGVLPPGKAYENARTVESPYILDWDLGHPLLQYVQDLGTVVVLKAVMVEPPVGAAKLIEAKGGTLAFVAPREGFADAVVGFSLFDGGELNSNWYSKISYPLFLFNALRTLGNARESVGEEVHQPNQPVVLRADSSADKVEVTSPTGQKTTLTRTPQGTFVYNDARESGLYHARWGADGLLTFAVNLFDARESDLATRGLVPAGVPDSLADQYQIKIGFNPVAATRQTAPVRKDWWKPIAVAALAIVLLEWYIYNRRVYI